MEWITALGGESWPFLSLALALSAVAIAHVLAFSLLCSMPAPTPTWRKSMSCLRWPTFWLAIAITTSIVLRSLRFPGGVESAWASVAGLLMPALFGWVAIGVLRAASGAISHRADVSVADNLRARRRRTRVAIVTRIGVFAILLVTAAAMLLSIPSIRSLGVTLMASAGIVAIVVGAAAQPAMKNLIAGIQMAFTEPIRIDDVVIIDGEWGRVEEIGLTFVVVALWDQRRLIVPVSKLLEQSFQNWTRRTSELLGTVFLYLDPRADVPRLRRKLGEILPRNDKWDGRVGTVQVTDMKAEAIEIRLLVSARDASKAFDLRCDVREAMIAFVQSEMPEALPHGRDILSGEIERHRKAA